MNLLKKIFHAAILDKTSYRTNMHIILNIYLGMCYIHSYMNKMSKALQICDIHVYKNYFI